MHETSVGISTAMSLTERIERLSNAVSMTVLEIDAYGQELVPAFLLADLMSPALWAWREQRRAHGADGSLLSARSRLDGLQRFFHRYTFTILPDQPGGDAWGLLNFAEEDRRFPHGFVPRIRREYDATFRRLAEENPESQFGRIVDQPYYRRGLFPRLKNETIEIMNAMAGISPQGRPSGKCIGLGMLWAAALAAWGRFPLDRIVITGNRAHMFVFLDIEEGHLLNNTKWFSTTRINNRSELSELARLVASGTETTFFYNPRMGMCHCPSRVSQIPRERITGIYHRIGEFVTSPLKHPDPARLAFIQRREALPDPAEHASAESYRGAVEDLARDFPGSVYEHALYAYRSLDVAHPQAYARAARREFHARQAAEGISTVEDALAIVRNVTGEESIFASRERVAMPDEVLLFNTGSDRDRALLLYALLHKLADGDLRIGFADQASFINFRGRWINAGRAEVLDSAPPGLNVIFSSHEVKWPPDPVGREKRT